MSDVQQGPGWWQASDGKWYAPKPRTPKKPSPLGHKLTLRSWQILAVVVLVFIAGAVAGAATKKDEPTTAAGTTAGAAASEAVPKAPVTTVHFTSTVAPPSPATAPPTAAATTTPPQPQTIASFGGSSTKQTEAFSVKSPWTIEWNVTGGAGIHITIHGSSGDNLSIDPGTDHSVVRSVCNGCYLEIEPFGSTYEVKITGIPL